MHHPMCSVNQQHQSCYANSPTVTITITADYPTPPTLAAVADSSCLTCTAGLDVLITMGLSPAYLVATKHRIVGITNSS